MLAFSRFTDGNHTLGYILRIGIARSLGVHSTNVIRKSQCFSEPWDLSKPLVAYIVPEFEATFSLLVLPSGIEHCDLGHQ